MLYSLLAPGRSRPSPAGAPEGRLLAAEARELVTLLDHTADAAIEARGRDLDRVCEAAVLGLMRVILGDSPVEPRAERRLRLEAGDRELLLVRLLREALYLYDTARWVVGAATVATAGGGTRLEAALAGEELDPARHAVETEVKAVTYHALSVRETAEGLRATVVFDL